MRLFRRQHPLLVALTVLAFAGNIAACAWLCAGGPNPPAMITDGVNGPLAFCAHDPVPGGDGKAGGPAHGAAHQHCIVCSMTGACLRLSPFLFLPFALRPARDTLVRPWRPLPQLALHIRSGALRSRAPPLIAP